MRFSARRPYIMSGMRGHDVDLAFPMGRAAAGWDRGMAYSHGGGPMSWITAWGQATPYLVCIINCFAPGLSLSLKMGENWKHEKTWRDI